MYLPYPYDFLPKKAFKTAIFRGQLLYIYSVLICSRFGLKKARNSATFQRQNRQGGVITLPWRKSGILGLHFLQHAETLSASSVMHWPLKNPLTLCLCGAILEISHDGIIVSEKTFIFLSGMVYLLKPVVEQIEGPKNREIQIWELFRDIGFFGRIGKSVLCVLFIYFPSRFWVGLGSASRSWTVTFSGSSVWRPCEAPDSPNSPLPTGEPLRHHRRISDPYRDPYNEMSG